MHEDRHLAHEARDGGAIVGKARRAGGEPENRRTADPGAK
jgi:hypothetical protein